MAIRSRKTSRRNPQGKSSSLGAKAQSGLWRGTEVILGWGLAAQRKRIPATAKTEVRACCNDLDLDEGGTVVEISVSAEIWMGEEFGHMVHKMIKCTFSLA